MNEAPEFKLTKLLNLVFAAAAVVLPVTLSAVSASYDCDANGAAYDNMGIQAAIDAAQADDRGRPGGSRVVLVTGTCNLDPGGLPSDDPNFYDTRLIISESNITLMGEWEDTNGNGRPDPDADTWGTVFVGDGTSEKNQGTDPYRNRAVLIGRSDEKISNVVIRHIKFVNLNRGISIQPLTYSTTNICDDFQYFDGTVSNPLIEENAFVGDAALDSEATPPIFGLRRGIQVSGGVDGAIIRNNHFSGQTSVGILAPGKLGQCADIDPNTGQSQPAFPPSGPITRMTVVDNVSENSNNIGLIATLRTEGTTVSNNLVVDSSSQGIDHQGDEKIRVTDNILVGNAVGIIFGFSADGHVARNTAASSLAGIVLTDLGQSGGPRPGFPTNSSRNHVVDNYTEFTLFAGILLDANTTGFSVVNNRFGDNNGLFFGPADIMLEDFPGPWASPVPYDNKIVTTNFSVDMLDLQLLFSGVPNEQNQYLGTLNLLSNPAVPPEVIDMLRENARGRPQDHMP